MKKFLIFALILAVAGGAFAQSLNTSGFFRTGLSYRFNDSDDAQGGLQFAHIDDFSHRAQLGIVIRNADGNAEAHFNFRINDGGAAVDGSSLRVHFLENTLRIAAGNGALPWDVNTQGGIGEGFGIRGNGGFHVSYLPISDLILHFSLQNLPNRVADVALPGRLLENLNYAGGLRYTLSGVGSFNLYAQYNGNRGGSATDHNWDGNYGRISLAVGANLDPIVSDIPMVTGVGIDVAVYDLTQVRTVLQNPLLAYNFQTNPRVKMNAMDIGIGQRLGFNFNGITLGLNLRQGLRLNDGGDMDFAFRVTADLAYPIPDTRFTPRLSVAYRLGNHGVQQGGNPAYRRADQIGWNNDVYDGLSAFALNPRVDINLTPGMAFELGYTFHMNMGEALLEANRVASTFHSVYMNIGLTF